MPKYDFDFLVYEFSSFVLDRTEEEINNMASEIEETNWLGKQFTSFNLNIEDIDKYRRNWLQELDNEDYWWDEAIEDFIQYLKDTGKKWINNELIRTTQFIIDTKKILEEE